MGSERDDRPTDPVTEADLHAWLDGELPEERLEAVERHLAANPELAARFERYRTQRTMLGTAFGPLIDRPVPERLAPPFAGRPADLPDGAGQGTGQGMGRGMGRGMGQGTVQGIGRPPARRPAVWGAALAASLLLFVAGGASGWLLRDRMGARDAVAAASFVADAVSAHRVFAVEVRHPVEIGGDQESHLVSWLSKRLGKQLRCPPLGKRGYELVGGRLLADADGPAAQLMYQDAAGRRITLYIRPSPNAPGMAFRYTQDGGLLAAYWRDNGLALAVTGDLDRATLSGIAEEVYGALNS
ncbi:anti-sigma factor family protein [Azospirillum thermophilum]|uniref:Transcriptional regulator n=1 Tax=Azospirillum thermophilum TaxID=2202148 RepID=A0A2S2CRX4_9PROT|nr:anti-sigma factor [Azospirillum thermophilum]AWK87273.1 transcriptional regulator [Azospirillum thermophilum]